MRRVSQNSAETGPAGSGSVAAGLAAGRATGADGPRAWVAVTSAMNRLGAGWRLLESPCHARPSGPYKPATSTFTDPAPRRTGPTCRARLLDLAWPGGLVGWDHR